MDIAADITAGPSILMGQVMHKRLKPKINAFRYSIYYVACPLSQIDAMRHGWRFGVGRAGLMSFYNRDHGDRTGIDLRDWIGNILRQNDIPQADGEVVLLTMPRVLGYVFNPVSFWLCHDKAGQIRAVLCEVNNTFGETHSYLCVHDDRRPITADDWMTGDKVFHVSPFMQREGHYAFRFSLRNGSFGAWIDHHDETGKSLLTALTGKLVPMTEGALDRAFCRTPLVTLKAIILIHWQAVKLLVRGIAYVARPEQRPERLTHTRTSNEIDNR